jgi:hypothetical protein
MGWGGRSHRISRSFRNHQPLQALHAEPRGSVVKPGKIPTFLSSISDSDAQGYRWRRSVDRDYLRHDHSSFMVEGIPVLDLWVDVKICGST